MKPNKTYCDECQSTADRHFCEECYQEKVQECDRYRNALEEALKALKRWTTDRRVCCEIQRILAEALKEEDDETVKRNQKE